ncbi:hypothetical protein GPECTOR_29g11 [Gonium pectorale]|uniref:Uncharacterized protein n=1 Tax=Gonium pectorale TaxID=33097 RepID=A0A150GEJ5_GONPE|nr:hypothetical protein GPECTOR_29g11 [Gonium pectorale]|eukprot:KXZ48203.1 hypothetical protein GPECTOR_29g11 [Gonium pectorale]
MSEFGPHRYAPCDWLELDLLQNSLPGEFTVQKVLHAYPLRLKLAATWDINEQQLRTKASERLLNGSFHYLHTEKALEYRKRFSLLGLACAHVWGRWDLRVSPTGADTSDASSASFLGCLRPRLGVSLSLGDGEGGPLPLPLHLLGSGVGTGAASLPLLLLRPLTHPFKAVVPAGPGLRLKARCEASLRLPRRLSLWGEGRADEYDDSYGNGDEPYSPRAPGFGGSGCALRLRLHRAALVLRL